MRKVLWHIALLIFGVSLITAKPVDEHTAALAGQTFLLSKTTEPVSKPSVDLELIYTEKSDEISEYGKIRDKIFYYVFSSGSSGFVIVSGDDQVFPILGYSGESAFDLNNIPHNVQKWLEEYKIQIRDVIDLEIPATPEIEEAWENYTKGVSATHAKAAGVGPLVKTKWNQAPYFNSQCPGNSPTGCVATAMAQIMKYWNYPATGSGFHSYNHNRYGTLSANFGSTTYQWNAMPNTLSGNNSAVATLMYHCGVSVDMDYSPQSSGAYVISDMSPVQHCSEYALKTYFGYKKSIRGVERIDYSQSQWINLLKNELNAGRPMLYAGFGSGGGHAFVCDGYDNNDYFHFNWGWGGSFDGYFHINALNPTGTGVGGGTGNYNNGHQVLIGIEPGVSNGGGTSDKPVDLHIYSNLSLPSDKIWFWDPINLSVDVANYGNSTFSGQIGAAIFNKNYEFVDFLEVKSVSLSSMKYQSLTFQNPGSAAFVPGNYYISMFYKSADKDWTIVGDGNYNNLKPFEIYYETDIEVNSNFTIKNNGGKLIQGTTAEVNVDVLNTLKKDFIGHFRVNLAKPDGKWVQNIAIISEDGGLGYNYHYKNGLNFIGDITAEPGTYLMEVAFIEQGTSNWYYGGSAKFPNPIYVIVEAPEIKPDKYENNNTVNQAYSLPVSFSGNTAKAGTDAANLHVGTDQDYYKISLPPGYGYSISARLHDSYNSGDGKMYSVDGLFSYSKDGKNWSDTYDDVMSGKINVQNGGTVYFLVAPYFAGETGTYLLDLNVQRTQATGIREIEQAELIRIFPNPAKDFVTVDFSAIDETIFNISVYNVQGQKMSQMPVSHSDTVIDISLKEMPEGLYFIHISSPNGILTRKIFHTP